MDGAELRQMMDQYGPGPAAPAEDKTTTVLEPGGPVGEPCIHAG